MKTDYKLSFKEYLKHFKYHDAFIEALRGVDELSKKDIKASNLLRDSIDDTYNQYLKAYDLELDIQQKEKDFKELLEEQGQ